MLAMVEVKIVSSFDFKGLFLTVLMPEDGSCDGLEVNMVFMAL